MEEVQMEEPVFRKAETLERLGSDHDLMKSMIKFFIDTYQEELLKMQKAIESGNNKNLEMHAHRFKGDLRSVGGERASTPAFALEEMGKNDNISLSATAFSKLTAEVKLLIESLEEFMREE